MLLCLHGYGNDHRLFHFVEALELGEMRIVAVDLPWFGRSQWGDPDPPIGPDVLREWLEKLRERFPETTHIDMLAFSLGAKVALGLFQNSPIRIRKMVLLAPDGLKIHPMYRFCIYNPVGQRLFRRVIKRPRSFLAVLRMLYKFRLADAFKFRFVQRQFERREAREQLERVWFGYSGIRPDRKLIAKRSRMWNTEWHLIWGDRDTVLPQKLANGFRKKVPDVRLEEVSAGHRLLSPPSNEVKRLLEKIWND